MIAKHLKHRKGTTSLQTELFPSIDRKISRAWRPSVSNFSIQSFDQVSFCNGTVCETRHKPTGAKVSVLTGNHDTEGIMVRLPTYIANNKGIAHAAEHLAMGAGARDMKLYFGYACLPLTDANAMVWNDRTMFLLTGDPKQSAEQYVGILLEQLLSFQKKDLDSYAFKSEVVDWSRVSEQRPHGASGVIPNEVTYRYYHPERTLHAKLSARLFSNMPHIAECDGTPHDAVRIKLDEVEGHLRHFYTAENMQFILIGPQDHRIYLNMIDEALHRYSSTANQGTSKFIPVKSKELTKPERVSLSYASTDLPFKTPKHFFEVLWKMSEKIEHTHYLILRLVTEYLLNSDKSPWNNNQSNLQLLSRKAFPLSQLDATSNNLILPIGGVANSKEVAEGNIEFIIQSLREQVEQGFDKQGLVEALDILAMQWDHHELYPSGLIWDELAMIPLNLPLSKVMDTPQILKNLRYIILSENGVFESVVKKHLIDNSNMVSGIFSPSNNNDHLVSIDTPKNTKGADYKKENINRYPQEALEIPRVVIPNIKHKKLNSSYNPRIKLFKPEGATLVIQSPKPETNLVGVAIKFNLSNVPQEFRRYAVMAVKCLLSTPLANDIGQQCSSFTSNLECSNSLYTNEENSYFNLQLLTKESNLSVVLQMIRKLLGSKIDSDSDFDFSKIISNIQAENGRRIMESPADIVDARMQAHFCEKHAEIDLITGISSHSILNSINTKSQKNLDVSSKMSQALGFLLNRQDLIINIATGVEHRDFARFEGLSFMKSFSFNKTQFPILDSAYSNVPYYEWIVPTTDGVLAAATGYNLYNRGLQDLGSVNLIEHYLNNVLLPRFEREVNGSYFPYAYFNRQTGVFTIGASQTGNIARTLALPLVIAKHFEKVTFSKNEISAFVEQTIHSERIGCDLLTDMATNLDYLLAGYGVRDSDITFRQIERTNTNHFRRFAKHLRVLHQLGHHVALGPIATMHQVNEQRVVTKEFSPVRVKFDFPY